MQSSSAKPSRTGIDSISSLKVLKNGAVAGQFVGLANENQLKSMVSR